MRKSTILTLTLICCFAAGFLSITGSEQAAAAPDLYAQYCIDNPLYTCVYLNNEHCVRKGSCDKCAPDERGILYKCYPGTYLVIDEEGHVVTNFLYGPIRLYCECVPDVKPHEEP